MKKLVKVVMAVLMMSMVVACSSGSDTNTDKEVIEINVGISPDYEPYESLDTDGNIVGFDADMVALFPSYLNTDDKEYKFTWQQMDFDNIVTQVQAGQVDVGISGFTYSKDRKVAWSNPYLDTSQVAVVLEDSDIKTKEDLKGKVLAAQSGATGEEVMKSIDTPDKNKVSVTKVNEIFSALTAKQYDAVIVDSGVANKYAKAQGFRILDDVLLEEKNYIIAKEGNDEMVELINQALDKFLASDDYQKLCEDYELAPITK